MWRIGRHHIKLPISGSAEINQLDWHLNKGAGKSDFDIVNASSGSIVLNVKKSAKTLYFSHNATSSQFSKIKTGSGISASKRIVCELGVLCTPALRCHLMVMSFDKEGNRIKLEKFASSQPVDIMPNDATDRVVIAIAFQGEGTAVIHDIRVELAGSAQQFTPTFEGNKATSN